MVQATFTNARQYRLVVGGAVLQGGQFPVTQLHGLALGQVGGEHQPGGRREQRQYRADLRYHGDRAYRRLDADHCRALVAPYGNEAALVQFIAQLRQRQRGNLQHIDTAQRRQPHPQCLAPQAVMVGGRILLGKTAGDQRLQVTVHLARRHLHMFREA
ncbi:hypothetical protein D3C75_1010170 [compost metagenome]